MKFSLKAFKLYKPLGFAMPTLLVILSLYYFDLSKQNLEKTLETMSTHGKVAGTQTASKDITKEIPIAPNAQIGNIDTSIKGISVTLVSTLSNDEIKKYYEDYMYTHGWEKSDNGMYKKGKKEMSIKITKNIVRIDLKKP